MRRIRQLGAPASEIGPQFPCPHDLKLASILCGQMPQNSSGSSGTNGCVAPPFSVASSVSLTSNRRPERHLVQFQFFTQSPTLRSQPKSPVDFANSNRLVNRQLESQSKNGKLPGNYGIEISNRSYIVRFQPLQFAAQKTQKMLPLTPNLPFLASFQTMEKCLA